MANKTLLIGDIGGTNARFAMADPERPGFRNEETLKCADFPSADDAIRHYLDAQSAGDPDVICLAAAGPVVDNAVNMTNNHWNLNGADIAVSFGIGAVRLLNDFEALACAIPHLQADDSIPIGSPLPETLQERFNVAVIGPGTGLGMAGLLKRGATVTPVVGEGGHVGFAPNSEIQDKILSALRGKFGRISVERLVSGSGIENIYWALSSVRGDSGAERSASEIFGSCKDGSRGR